MANVTIREVAKESGTSITSVSHILRGAAGYRYRPDTVERVREAAQRLGYQAHAAARLLRQQKTMLVGLAVTTEVLGRPSINLLVVAAEHELEAQGYQPILVDPDQMMPAHSQMPFPSPELLAGIISVDLSLEKTMPLFYEAVKSVLPVVAMYPVRNEEIDYVTTDRVQAVEKAVAHLVELGHQRIAFAEAMDDLGLIIKPKIQGWRRALRRHRINAHPDYCIALSSPGDIPHLGLEIAEAITAFAEPPTALVCTGDLVAMSAISHLHQRGLRVPQDISVIGFDDAPYGAYFNPPLTTIAQPYDLIAQAAVKRLLQLIENKHATPPQPCPRLARKLAPELIVRKSTAPPPPV